MSEKFPSIQHEKKGAFPTQIEGLESFSGYTIQQKEGFYYIVNSKDKIVSKPYHQFRTFKVGEAVALLGKIGAKERLLKLPQNEDDFFAESEADFHDIRFDDATQLLLATTGAMNYIVDPATGKIISDGYHDLFWRGGKLYGKTGATEYEVYQKKDSRLNNEPRLLKSNG